jgi:SPP1 family predicted phage head-tail adaptor
MPGNLGRVNLAQVSGAGSFKYRMTFAARDTAKDDYGNTIGTWTDRFTLWANIIPRLGGEAVMAARLSGMQPVIIRVRQSPDTDQITTDWKATDEKGKIYNIRTTVDPLAGEGEAGKYYDMMAETGVAV